MNFHLILISLLKLEARYMEMGCEEDCVFQGQILEVKHSLETLHQTFSWLYSVTSKKNNKFSRHFVKSLMQYENMRI